MPLHKIKDFDPDYRNHFEGQDVIGYSLYAADDKIGSVDDILVDDAGKIRYLIINTGAWIFGKQVLMPIGQAQIDDKSRRIVANHLTRAQVESLPEYSGKPVEYEQEEQVRDVYRPAKGAATTSTAGASAYDRNSYSYDRDPDLYNLDERKHQNLRLYEERLIASKNRAKTGEVAVGKHVETETSRVSVPIEKERVVIERTAPAGAGAAIEPDSDAFRDGEVARMEVYEETPDIRKEAFVREEVSVRKEVDRETKEAEESLRREELDVNTEGRPVVDKGIDTHQSQQRL